MDAAVRFSARFYDVPQAFDRQTQTWAEQAPVWHEMVAMHKIIGLNPAKTKFVIGKIPFRPEFADENLFPDRKSTPELSELYNNRRAHQQNVYRCLCRCAASDQPVSIAEYGGTTFSVGKSKTDVHVSLALLN